MHKYGEQGLCLIWGVNNALQKNLVTKERIFAELVRMDHNNIRRNRNYYVANDGLNFKSFKVALQKVYGVGLRKMKKYKLKGSYLLTYDFGDYYHTVALVNGEILDSRKEKEITSLETNRKLVDIYKVVK